MRLVDFLFPPRVDEILIRNIAPDAFCTLIDPKIVPKTQPETVALLQFADTRVRGAIHEAKYHGNTHALELLAVVLSEYLRDADDIRKPIIVPVPLGKERRKERGFNQSEEIARRVSQAIGIAVDATLLERTRETASQVSLPRDARQENMRGAFLASQPADPIYTYIVIDDVITTGATLGAAIDALRNAGATHIVPLALAH